MKKMWNKITWPIRRTWRKVKRVWDFLPIIWSGYDFDYRYAIELFQYQLERTADFMESDRAMTVDADKRAQKIRTAVELLEKVYDKEEYSVEYQDKLVELYGEDVLNSRWEPVEDDDDLPEEWGTGLVEHHWEYEYWDNADEVREMSDKLFKESQDKQQRAEKLVWEFISHNIRGWWD